MELQINTSERTRTIHNFWNHIHFHPTDAIEDDWGQRILNRIHEDGIAGTVHHVGGCCNHCSGWHSAVRFY